MIDRGSRPRAAVVGAGIAGIAVAHGLTRIGWQVRLLEREAALRTEGAGLVLWPNAIRALRELGLADPIVERGHPLTAGVTLTAAGQTIAQAPFDRIGERFGPLLSIPRGELLESLHEQAGIPIEFGARVRWEDESLYLDAERLEADLVIGADGIGSLVRRAIAPDAEARPAGYGAWRGIAPTGDLTPARVSETFGRGERFGLVPLQGGRTYWFAVVADGGITPEEAFTDWHDPIAGVLAATPASERSYLDLADLPRLPRWHREAAVLVGDAAHAMTPNLGQGAAQALIDAASLPRQIQAHPLPTALRSYERERKRPAERIVRQSYAMGRFGQTGNPLAASLRDGLARLLPQALVARQIARVLR